MCGIGINTNTFNFQIPSASYGYFWRYGGTNETGTLMFQCRTATINTVANTPCIGVGLSGAPAYQLHLNVDSAGKPGTGGLWTVSSDERLKENIELADLELCYDNIKNLPLKRFRWKDETYTDEQISDRNVVGWIAQDVEKVFPKSVSQKEMHGLSDCRDVNGDQINMAMFGAMKKMMEKIETMENKIMFLENELKNL